MWSGSGGRRSLLAATAAVVFLAAAPSPRPRIETKYDRFRQLTIVEPALPDRFDRGVGLCDRPAVSWLAEVKDTEAGGESAAHLHLVAVCDRPTYQRSGTVFLLVDGEPEQVGPTAPSAEVVRGGRIFETVFAGIPSALMDRLAGAESVEMQHWGVEWQLSSEEMVTLRAFRAEWRRVEAERLGG